LPKRINGVCIRESMIAGPRWARFLHFRAASALPLLDFRVKGGQLRSGIVDRQLPLN
jgi:hypothetical protein